MITVCHDVFSTDRPTNEVRVAGGQFEAEYNQRALAMPYQESYRKRSG